MGAHKPKLCPNPRETPRGMLWAVGSHPGMCRVAVPGWGTGLSPPRSSCWWPRPALGQRLAPGLPGGLPMLMSPGGLVAPAGTRGDTAGDTTGTPSSPADPAMPRSFLVKKKPPSTRGPNYGQLHARGEAAPGTPDPNWCLGGGEFPGLGVWDPPRHHIPPAWGSPC